MKVREAIKLIEETATGYSAYSPDLPGCIATAPTRENIEQEMHAAMEFHVEGLQLAGVTIPSPHSQASYCEIAASDAPFSRSAPFLFATPRQAVFHRG